LDLEKKKNHIAKKGVIKQNVTLRRSREGGQKKRKEKVTERATLPKKGGGGWENDPLKKKGLKKLVPGDSVGQEGTTTGGVQDF